MVFDTNVNEKMIEEHHAVRYMGQSKKISQKNISKTDLRQSVVFVINTNKEK